MLAQSFLLLLFLLAGAAVQMTTGMTRLRDALWIAFFWTFSPVLVFVTFLTVDLDAGLGRALAAVILASWLVGLAGYGYARLVATERDERGALTLAGGPLALLGTGALLGASVPGVFYLLAAMPSAFHLLILASVYEVRPALINRIVVGTTIPAVALVVLVTGIVR